MDIKRESSKHDVNVFEPHIKNIEIYGDPLKYINPKEIDDYNKLKEQIKKSKWIKPIAVTTNFKILDGMRRWSAAKELGWKEIPAYLIEIAECDEIEYIINSNIYREYKTEETKLKEYKELEIIYSKEAKESHKDGTKKGGGDHKSEQYKENRTEKRVSQTEKDEEVRREEVRQHIKDRYAQAKDRAAKDVGGSRPHFTQSDEIQQKINILKEQGKLKESELLSIMRDTSVKGAFEFIKSGFLQRILEIEDKIRMGTPVTQIISYFTEPRYDTIEVRIKFKNGERTLQITQITDKIGNESYKIKNI